LAVGAALVSFTFAAYFAGTPEVRIRLDEEPSGFDNPTTSLKLDQSSAQIPRVADAPRHNRTWSDLDNSTN
jgi:hypothetical protein